MPEANGFLSNVTPVILTYNEAANIGRALSKLTWASEVLIVDSFSDDGTTKIAGEYSNVRMVQRLFDQHASQWNFAISKCDVSTEWVLALDADWLMSDELIDELAKLSPNDEAGYEIQFDFALYGQPLRGSAYPPVVALFRRPGARFVQVGHTQRVHLSGAIGALRERLKHDDRKSLAQWLWSQARYAALEARHLENSKESLPLTHRLRRLGFVTPWLIPVHCLFIKGGILDGRAGLVYALQRCVVELLILIFRVSPWPEAHQTARVEADDD